MTSKSPTLAEEIALRIRELRTERGWSQAQLASEMAALGFAWTRMTVTEVEGPRQRAVSVAELFGLAHSFDVGIKRILGVTLWAPPTSPGANLLEITPGWVIHRRDARALVDTGRRSSAKTQELRGRMDELLDEARRLDAQQDAITARWEQVRGELEQIEDELKSAREQTEEEQ